MYVIERDEVQTERKKYGYIFKKINKEQRERGRGGSDERLQGLEN